MARQLRIEYGGAYSRVMGKGTVAIEYIKEIRICEIENGKQANVSRALQRFDHSVGSDFGTVKRRMTQCAGCPLFDPFFVVGLEEEEG